MAPRNPYAVYQNNRILSASPEELTLMLYDGSVKFCKIAIDAMKNRDVQTAHKNIIKIENIILELQMTLNRKYTISKDLDEMYQLIHDKLVHANMRQDLEVLEQCQELLEELRNTWKEAMLMARKEKAAAANK